MANSSIMNKAITVGIGLLLVFLLSAAIVMPRFSDSWRYCQDVRWDCAAAGAVTNCTYDDNVEHFNNSYVDTSTGARYTRSGIGTYDVVLGAECSDMCLRCITAGGYRASAAGLQLLILVLALIGFGLLFFKL